MAQDPSGSIQKPSDESLIENRRLWVSFDELDLPEEDLAQLVVQRKMDKYTEGRRKLDEKGRTKDRRIFVNPTTAILPETYRLFRYRFEEWFSYVDTTNRQWDRKLKIQQYKEHNKVDGFWGSWKGAFVSDYISPKFCGAELTSPPHYNAVWGPEVQEAYDRYEFHLYGGDHKHIFFWAAFGFFGTIGAITHASLRYSTVSPRLANLGVKLVAPFLVGSGMSIFPGSWTHIWGKERRSRESMDNLLRDRGTFLSAKARLMYPICCYSPHISSADEVMWPEGYHNRQYLTSLPRDKFDEFVWSVDDDDIANNTFAKEEWAFALAENQKLEELSTYEAVKKDAYYWLGNPYRYRAKELVEADKPPSLEEEKQ